MINDEKREKIICPYCEKPAKLDSSLRIYQKDYGYIWICQDYPSCDAYVGCHAGTKKPKGSLANEELRAWRKEAHKYFDELWKRKINILNFKNGFKKAHKKQARSKAYKWLANELQIDAEYCHIALFDIEMCQNSIDVCEPYYEKIKSIY